MTRLRRDFLCLGILAISLNSAVPTFGQSARDEFNPNVTGPVQAIALQADGKILIGGNFPSVGGAAHTNIARLHSDGRVDNTFSLAAINEVCPLCTIVNSFAAQADGKILVAGGFRTLGGEPRPGLARLNTDGSLDSSFNPQAFGEANAMAVQADGKILLGGKGVLLRLNADGTVDATFHVARDANAVIETIAVQADGKIILGGSLQTVGGQPRANIARISSDGSVDPDFNPGANGRVETVAIQADGKIVVGGSFSTLGGQTRRKLGRLNADGSVDLALSDPGVIFSPANVAVVQSLAVQPDGKILFGGVFDMVCGTVRFGLARLEANGQLDTIFNPGPNGSVLSIIVQPDAKILLGGNFTNIGGTNRNHLARLYSNGSLDATLNPGADDAVRGLAVQADGKIIVAGDFIELGGPPRSGLGRLNPDGTLDMGFDPAPDGYVLSVIVQPDTRILLGGGFATLSGQPRSGLGRLNLDGSLDEHFNADVNGGVLCLALQSDGKILVGGEFTMLDGQPRRNLGRLNSDGTIDAAFTAAASGWVSALAVQADGKILVGGAFTNLNDEEVGLMGRLNADGSLDESFSPGVRGPVPFGNPYVACLAVEPDGRILVGGWFGFPSANLFRVGDAAFTPQATGPIQSLSLQTDGKILVGGSFTSLGGQARANIGRLHRNGNLDLAFDPGASDVVDSLVIQSDGKILAGGEFGGTLGILGGQMRRALGRLTSDGATRQTLTIDAGGTTAKWTRSGPGPEVQTATLEWSTDGTNYVLLGNGVRISSGWKFTELSLPMRENFYLRARGSAIGGQYNGCVSLIESVAQFYLPGTSPVLVALRLASADQFRFGFSYPPGIDFSVRASTNIALSQINWTAQGTPTEFAPRLYQFAEETAPNDPQRFYYLRSP